MGQPGTEWTRECPQCDRKLTYKLQFTRDRAETLKSLCKSCGIKNAKAAWTDEDRKRAGANVSAALNARTPEQKAERRRKHQETLAAWGDEKKQARSDRRRQYNLEHFKGEGNPFYGKRHKPETIELLKAGDKSYTKTPEFAQKVRDAMVGIDTSVDVMQVWTDKYGVEEAQRLEIQRRERLSKSMSGEGNPMFGRPAPLAAGGGVKGWYGTHFFRSLRELAYMLQLDREGKSWKTGETVESIITYVNPYTGKLGTYRPDFIVDDTRMVECKPKNLQGTVMVKTKAQAAREFCAQRGMTYEFVDPGKLTWDELFELERTGVVKLTERTKEKLNAQHFHNERFTWEREEP